MSRRKTQTLAVWVSFVKGLATRKLSFFLGGTNLHVESELFHCEATGHNARRQRWNKLLYAKHFVPPLPSLKAINQSDSDEKRSHGGTKRDLSLYLFHQRYFRITASHTSVVQNAQQEVFCSTSTRKCVLHKGQPLPQAFFYNQIPSAEGRGNLLDVLF